MTERLWVADVGLDVRAAGAEALFTYAGDETVRLGAAHFVPLGTRQVVGIVLECRQVSPADLPFEAKQLRPLGPAIAGLGLTPLAVELVHELARQTATSLPVALAPFLPPAARSCIRETWVAEATSAHLTPAQAEALRVVREQGGIVVNPKKPLEQAARARLRSLEKLGAVTRTMRLIPPAERSAGPKWLRLTDDLERVDRFLRENKKKNPAQAMALMQMQDADQLMLPAKELATLARVSPRTIKLLLDAKLLEPVGTQRPPGKAPQPNAEQQAAIDAICKCIDSRKFHRFLLHGVTGSGKTEVYLRAASQALRQGRQALYLVPEIALTAQVVSQLRERFGDSVAVIHSHISDADRLREWSRIRTREAPIVLGARSALFAPFSDLGLIVIDEEHEASYKQDSSPGYTTSHLARFLAQRSAAVLVEGSATPSVESYFAAQSRERDLLRLDRRVAGAQLPKVQIVDLAADFRDNHAALLTKPLLDALAETMERGEQAILFLNRRGYAPFLACRDCGFRINCISCAVTLTYHREEALLKCHHCGRAEKTPTLCPRCGKERFLPFGVGAEKVETAVREAFPSANVARLDRDVAARVGALERIFSDLRTGNLHVLVGTQIVAKGLDFPNVTLVGVIAADISLAIPDFRATERTFQLLAQVAGRAGRGSRPGRVVVQTLSPDCEAIVCAAQHDYVRFYESVIEERRLAGYPPFVRLVNLLVTGASYASVKRVSEDLAHRARSLGTDVHVLGPADCAIGRIKERWRRHVLLKMPRDADVARLSGLATGLMKEDARIHIDIDPNNLL